MVMTKIIRGHWLFFQNVIQMQLHGGKNPIVLVLYWEMIQMKLQDLTCTSAEPTAATTQQFNWSGPPSWIMKLSLGRS